MNFGDAVQIKGCSIKGRFLETSSGNTSIDHLLGGALPNSSITIVDETKSRVYASVLTKYFISEGLYNDQDILVVDPCCSINELYDGLPTQIAKVDTTNTTSSEKESLKIAWRYEAAPKMNSAIGSKNRYDLGKCMQENDLSKFQSLRKTFPHSDSLSYRGLLQELKQLLSSDRYSKNKTSITKNLLRIVIRNIGSPLWEDSENLSPFLAHLQYITRNSYTVVMATTCSSILPLNHVMELENAADCFFRLVAMSEEEKKSLPSLDKAHGYFYIVRLPKLTSIASHCPSAVDLTFELHRRSFDVKILHLPPALSGPEPDGKTACSSIDF